MHFRIISSSRIWDAIFCHCASIALADNGKYFVSKRIVAMIEGTRIWLNRWQQAAVALGSAVGALLDPRRADLFAVLGETTRKPAFERVLERMKSSPEGRAILLERPRVVSVKVVHASDLSANTFGAAYARFMGSRNFSPDDRPPVRFMIEF